MLKTDCCYYIKNRIFNCIGRIKSSTKSRFYDADINILFQENKKCYA